jgi:hypothetical protein
MCAEAQVSKYQSAALGGDEVCTQADHAPVLELPPPEAGS